MTEPSSLLLVAKGATAPTLCAKTRARDDLASLRRPSSPANPCDQELPRRDSDKPISNDDVVHLGLGQHRLRDAPVTTQIMSGHVQSFTIGQIPGAEAQPVYVRDAPVESDGIEGSDATLDRLAVAQRRTRPVRTPPSSTPASTARSPRSRAQLRGLALVERTNVCVHSFVRSFRATCSYLSAKLQLTVSFSLS